jgi:hypothetical protein
MAEKQGGFFDTREIRRAGRGGAPAVAVYSVDVLGRPQKRLGKLEGDTLQVPPEWLLTHEPAASGGADARELSDSFLFFCSERGFP